MPAGLFAADILRDWQPLGPQDVLLNLCRGTRLWPAHDLCNSLAMLSGSSTIPYGSPDGGDLARWVDFFGQCGANALAADTPTIRELLRFCRLTGRGLGWLRTLIWIGSALDGAVAELIEEVVPQAEVWGLYGSVESWAVAGNGPRCGRNVFHPLPHQYVELLDGELLVSTLHERAITPLLRYRTGDTGEFVHCPCGSDRPALRLLGRLDDVLSFRGARFSRSELVALACSVEEVVAADVLVLDAALPTERLRLRVSLSDGLLADRYQVEWIKECVLGRHLTLSRVIETALIGRGDQHRLIGVHAGGSRAPASQRTLERGEHFFRMEGRAVREFVQAELPAAVGGLLDRAGMPAEQIQHFVPHQANGVMLAEVWPGLGLPNAELHLTVDQHANTGAASVAVTLDTVHRRGALGRGDLVLLAGFGGGMNIGAALLRRALDRPTEPLGIPGVRRGRPGGGTAGLLGAALGCHPALTAS